MIIKMIFYEKAGVNRPFLVYACACVCLITWATMQTGQTIGRNLADALLSIGNPAYQSCPLFADKHKLF